MFIPLWLLILLAVWLVVAVSGRDHRRAELEALQDELETLRHPPIPDDPDDYRTLDPSRIRDLFR